MEITPHPPTAPPLAFSLLAWNRTHGPDNLLDAQALVKVEGKPSLSQAEAVAIFVKLGLVMKYS